jgi:hypothetical protein
MLQPGDEAVQIVGEILEAAGGVHRRCGRIAVAAQIRGDDMITAGKGLEQLVEEGARGNIAMHEDDGRAAWFSGGAVVGSQPGRCDVLGTDGGCW